MAPGAAAARHNTTTNSSSVIAVRRRHGGARLPRPVRTASPLVQEAAVVEQLPPQQQQQAQEQASSSGGGSSGFSWTKNWWPVAPLSYLDKTRPQAVTLLGHNYVVWWNDGRWRVQEDRCPHRLAPLSEGRIEADGTLSCSYHGWQFDGAGRCTRIPQIGDPAKQAAACASPRACVATFPAAEVEGVLFAWLESGPQAEREAAARAPYVMPELRGTDAQWGMTVSPTDYSFWLEQGMDPSHANFLHHTCGFPMAEALPMPGDVLSPKNVDVAGGYTWTHGGYSKKQGLDMVGVREFVPPCSLRVVYDKGFVRGFATMGVPVRPGVSRVFGRFAFGPPPALITDGAAGDGNGTAGDQQQQPQPPQPQPPKKKGAARPPLLFALLGKLPHWTRNISGMGTTLADQDSVINAKQQAYMHAQGLGPDAYAAFARADQGVLAAHRWFSAAGYEAMWADRLGPAAAAAAAAGAGSSSSSNGSGSSDASPQQQPQAVGARYAFKPFAAPQSDDAYFDQYERHTKHCAECLAGMKLMQQAADAAAVAAAALGALAAALAAAARSALSPGALLAAAGAAAAWWLRGWLLDYRETQFVSSKRRWQRQGGLSLVAGAAPIRLPPVTPEASAAAAAGLS